MNLPRVRATNPKHRMLTNSFFNVLQASFSAERHHVNKNQGFDITGDGRHFREGRPFTSELVRSRWSCKSAEHQVLLGCESSHVSTAPSGATIGEERMASRIYFDEDL